LPGGTKTAKLTFTVGQEETVETPAGTFKAIRVTSEMDVVKGTTTAWYAPGVGMVKYELGTEGIQVLKSFTPGK
jgi:hypothetical protein